ncbi:uncharacterized protein A4U43_C09F14710 [Asparagus officinalis]|uniref:Uncharacterized protein n=1 Tax=Asparagus officinalis TaxID=4686 RepID=A0A5P1E7Q1_ASPOF|nr:uncharacterized protein A4U43_C09F14710 [Asparagus officinalis]
MGGDVGRETELVKSSELSDFGDLRFWGLMEEEATDADANPLFLSLLEHEELPTITGVFSFRWDLKWRSDPTTSDLKWRSDPTTSDLNVSF